MQPNNIQQLLIDTFEDFKLTGEEKQQLRDAFKPFEFDSKTLQYARNQAFFLVKKQIGESPENHCESLRWLEGVIKALDSVRYDQVVKKTKAYFSPGSSCIDRIVSLFNAAEESVDICVFTISCDVISDAIIAAHKRGVKIRVISDDDKADDLGSDIARFIGKKIKVKTDDSPSHMHHKFAIFDQRILLNGSFNWTRSATMNNNENIVVDTNPALVQAFQQEFDSLWQQFIWARSKAEWSLFVGCG